MGDLQKTIGDSFDPMTGRFNPGGLLSPQVRQNNQLKRSMMQEDLRASETRRKVVQQTMMDTIRERADVPQAKALRRQVIQDTIEEGGTRRQGQLNARALGLGKKSIDTLDEDHRKLVGARTEMTNFVRQNYKIDLPNTIGLWTPETFNLTGSRIVTSAAELANELTRIGAAAGAEKDVATHKRDMERGLIKLQARVNNRYDIAHSRRLDKLDEQKNNRGMTRDEYQAFLQQEVDMSRIGAGLEARLVEAANDDHLKRRQIKARLKAEKKLFGFQTAERIRLEGEKSSNRLTEMARKGEITLDIEAFKSTSQKELEQFRNGLKMELEKYTAQLDRVSEKQKGHIRARIERLQSNLALTEMTAQAQYDLEHDKTMADYNARIDRAKAAGKLRDAQQLDAQRQQYKLDLLTKSAGTKESAMRLSAALAVEKARTTGRYTVTSSEATSIQRNIYSQYASLFDREVVDASGNLTDTNLKPEDRERILKASELAKIYIENYGVDESTAVATAIHSMLTDADRSVFSFRTPHAPKTSGIGLGLRRLNALMPGGTGLYGFAKAGGNKPTSDDISRSVESFRYAMNREVAIMQNPELRRYTVDPRQPGADEVLIGEINQALEEAGIPAEFQKSADPKKRFVPLRGYDATGLPESFLEQLGTTLAEVMGRLEL